MDAVATRAIGGNGGTVLRGQAMVAVEERRNPIAREIVLGVQALGRMTIAAYVRGNLHGRTGLEPHDFVFGMTIGAGRCVAVPLGHCFSVHALGHISRCRLVATATGLR